MSANTNSPAETSESVVESSDLSHCWQTARSADCGFALEVLTRLVRSDESVVDWIRVTVDQIQDLTSAERIFFFDAKGTLATSPAGEPTAAVEVGQCIHSSDFDKESVPKAAGKAPMELLTVSLHKDEPIWALDTLKDADGLSLPTELVDKTRGFAVVPLSVHGICHGVLYFEHRFQPLRISAASAEQLLLLLRCLAIRQAFEKLEKENRSLWGDVLQMRKQLKVTENVAAGKPNDTSGAKEALIGDYSIIIGSSPCMMEIFKLLDRIRNSNAPVLINGESGTGKELVAHAIHHNSPRDGRDFVSENCAALTETLLESELFGYVRGAFTGANRDHKGLFELADGGTLFLDEVGDMSSNMQKKLLRAVQEGVVRRVGGKEYISVDVRIISATNKDLLQEVRKGQFREDLYYRLNVINIKLPPLRERREDIAELIHYFLSAVAGETGLEKKIEQQALLLLGQYDWPGNVRELQNEVKRLYALSDQRIEVANLSEGVRKGTKSAATLSGFDDELHTLTLKEAVERVERALIKRALLEAGGNKSQVAKTLRIPKTSLYNKITKYHLDDEVDDLLF